MKDHYPLTVYFDASCGLCNSEMQAIKTHDSAQRLNLVDCSHASFDDAPYRADCVTREDMMKCLHVRDSHGEWIKGVSAFELLYRTVDLSTIANLWGSRFTRPLAERIYPWIARHRQVMSWMGLPILFKLWSKCAARRSYKRGRRCNEGQCKI